MGAIGPRRNGLLLSLLRASLGLAVLVLLGVSVGAVGGKVPFLDQIAVILRSLP